MTKSERERRHQASLERINQVQLVVGRGDRMRVDHEGTLLERARMLAAEMSAHTATERGLAALDRLLRVAQDPQEPHARDVLDFITSVWNHKPLSLLTLRAVDESTGDDMLAVLDAFRHGRLNLVENVDGGPHRVSRILKRGYAARTSAPRPT